MVSAAFSPDGSRIVTASWDKTARIWDAATAKEIAVLRGHDGPVVSAAFSPDGSRIVTASEDKTARIWDAATAKEIAVLRGHERDGVFRRLQPRRVAHRHGVSTTRPPASGTPPAPRRSRSCAAMTAAVVSAAFSPDGSRIVTASSRQDRPHLGRRDRQGDRGPARP